MNRERLFIISTVGTSILLNAMNEEENQEYKSRFNEASNQRDEKDIDDDLVQLVNNLAFRIREKYINNQGSLVELRKASAELNGIVGIYEGDFTARPADVHWLICTDTVWGKKAASVVAELLRAYGFTVLDEYTPHNFSAKDTASFNKGVKELIAQCEWVIPDYKEAGYSVYFNLTGSFKSLQGYLNTVGMFYADRISYIFETSQELITIPRLPIEIDITIVQKHAVKIAMMDAGYMCPLPEIEGIPETFIEDDGKHAFLSPWGELIWMRTRDRMFSGQLLEFPRLDYQPSFNDDFKRAEKQEKIYLQVTLAKVSALLEESGGNLAKLRGDGGLRYETYTNQGGIDHIRVTRGLRVSCEYQDGILKMRRFGKEPEVNNNP